MKGSGSLILPIVSDFKDFPKDLKAETKSSTEIDVDLSSTSGSTFGSTFFTTSRAISLGKFSSTIISSKILAIGIGSEGILKKEDDDFAWDRVCIKIKVREVVLNLLLSCDATWKMIDGVYPELKSKQDKYRFKVEFRETELE